MTGRWQDLDGTRRALVAAVFAALDATEQLDTVRPRDDDAARTLVSPSPSPSLIWSSLMSGRELPDGVRNDDDLEALLVRAALAVFPTAAAAATPGAGLDRQVGDVRLRTVPSRADARQTYLILSVAPSSAPQPPMPTRLIVVADGGSPVGIDLPPPVDGTVQVLLADDAAILVALTAPDSRIYLV